MGEVGHPQVREAGVGLVAAGRTAGPNCSCSERSTADRDRVGKAPRGPLVSGPRRSGSWLARHAACGGEPLCSPKSTVGAGGRSNEAVLPWHAGSSCLVRLHCRWFGRRARSMAQPTRLSRRPLSRPFRLFIGAILKRSSGSWRSIANASNGRRPSLHGSPGERPQSAP
jgi:hypothetical protein